MRDGYYSKSLDKAQSCSLGILGSVLSSPSQQCFQLVVLLIPPLLLLSIRNLYRHRTQIKWGRPEYPICCADIVIWKRKDRF